MVNELCGEPWTISAPASRDEGLVSDGSYRIRLFRLLPGSEALPVNWNHHALRFTIGKFGRKLEGITVPTTRTMTDLKRVFKHVVNHWSVDDRTGRLDVVKRLYDLGY